MSTDHGSPSSQSPRFVVIAIALLSVVFAVGLSVLIFYMLRPRGEKVGAASLTDPKAVLVVNAKPGDSLVFRVDASIGIPRIGLLNDEQLEQQASAQLRKSMLTVHASAPSGTERAASCAVYKGRAMSTSTTSGALSRSGMLNDCVIVLDQPGPWKVRGSVAWASDLTLHGATLETRLEAAAH